MPATPVTPRLTALQIDGMRRREPEALGLLFEAYFDAIYALVHRLIGHREGAEDVTQDVFYRAYAAIDSLDPSRDPGPWLVTIAMNACRDHWRRSATRMARRTRSLDDADDTDMGGHEPGPAEAYEAERRRLLVEEAVGALPESLRVAVILKDFAGLEHSEIAAAVGSTPVAVRKRYSRALAELARRLRGLLA